MKSKGKNISNSDWLITVFCSTNDDVLKHEAYEKLVDKGFDNDKILNRFKELSSDSVQIKAFDKAWEKQLENNQFERYSFAEKTKIFFFGPYKLFKFFDSGLIYLYKQNYKIKFCQKLILLISGIIFWILFVFIIYKYSEHIRLQEINQTDISIWEKRMKE